MITAVDVKIRDDQYKYAGYFISDGEKYYQTAISVWIGHTGILSLYPGGEGWTLDGKSAKSSAQISKESAILIHLHLACKYKVTKKCYIYFFPNI